MIMSLFFFHLTLFTKYWGDPQNHFTTNCFVFSTVSLTYNALYSNSLHSDQHVHLAPPGHGQKVKINFFEAHCSTPQSHLLSYSHIPNSNHSLTSRYPLGFIANPCPVQNPVKRTPMTTHTYKFTEPNCRPRLPQLSRTMHMSARCPLTADIYG